MLPGMAVHRHVPSAARHAQRLRSAAWHLSAPDSPRYGIFGICTLMVIGVFGFLRLRRWGWSIVAAGFLLLAAGDFYLYSHQHVGFLLIRALFSIVFFLYLSRTEVRERLR